MFLKSFFYSNVDISFVSGDGGECELWVEDEVVSNSRSNVDKDTKGEVHM